MSCEPKNASELIEYDNPLSILDILIVCQQYSILGWDIQGQIINILELGVEESVRNGQVKRKSLPVIKKFLKKIVENPYFGDAFLQAQDCLDLINRYEEKYKIEYLTDNNN